MFTINILTNFVLIQTAAMIEPVVDIQPTIVTFPVTFDENTEVATQKSKNLMGINTNRALMLEFSVNYMISTGNTHTKIYKRFDLKETNVTLKKYKKKEYSSQIYVEALDGPYIVILPTNTNDIFGFYFYIAKSTVLRNFDQLRKGCQLFSLYSDKDRNTTTTASEVKETIDKFRELFKLKNTLNPRDWGFRFHIEIKSKTGESIKIFTDMFEILFDEYSLKTVKVDPKDYHYGLKDAERSETSEMQKAEDKKFCCLS